MGLSQRATQWGAGQRLPLHLREGVHLSQDPRPFPGLNIPTALQMDADIEEILLA